MNVDTIESYLNHNKQEIYFSNLILIHKDNTTQTWQVMKEIISKAKHNIRKFIKLIMNKNSVADKKLIAHSCDTYNLFTDIGPNQDKQVEKPSQYV